MRFLVDECTGPTLARWLRSEGHDTYSVFDQSPGLTDDQVLENAFVEGWILIINDKDFGERVFRDGLVHRGVIPLRLGDERSANKIETMRRLLEAFAERPQDRFVVVTETQVRFSAVP